MYTFLTCSIKQVKQEWSLVLLFYPDYLLCNVFWGGTNTAYCQENVILQEITSKDLFKNKKTQGLAIITMLT